MIINLILLFVVIITAGICIWINKKYLAGGLLYPIYAISIVVLLVIQFAFQFWN